MKRPILAVMLLAAIPGGLVLLGSAASISVLGAIQLPASKTPATQTTAGHPAGQTPAGNTVTLTNFQFSPKSVTIKAGSEVTWEVKEGTHTIIADKGFFESQTLSAGQKFSHKFEKPGVYQYYCSFHGSKGGHEMAGTVRVTK